MKTLIITVTIVFSGMLMQAQTDIHQFSSAPETARFQIVQSELGARDTFMIDKYTGRVFLMVKDGSELAWEIMEAEEQAYDETKPDQVNYQLFTSGLGSRYTFLINVNTGITWQMAKDKNLDILHWIAL